jgi:hypothetical protein
MLAACRLAGLSALDVHYAGLVALRQTKGVDPCPLGPPERTPALRRCMGCGWPGGT